MSILLPGADSPLLYIYPIHDFFHLILFHFISFYIVLLDILIVLSTVFLVFKNLVPPFCTCLLSNLVNGRIKIRKRIFDINLGPVRNKTRKKSAILLTDSKGKYISEQIPTESFLDFQIASQPSITIETPETAEFIWSILKNLLEYQDKTIIFLWLRHLRLHHKISHHKINSIYYTELQD